MLSGVEYETTSVGAGVAFEYKGNPLRMTRIMFILVVLAVMAMDGAAWADSPSAMTAEIASLEASDTPKTVNSKEPGHLRYPPKPTPIGDRFYGALLVMFGVLLAGGLNLIFLRLEWRRRNREKQVERVERELKEIEILRSCIIAVNNEVQQNQSYLKEMAKLLPKTTPPFGLATISFECTWRVFVESGLFVDREEQFQIINRLFYEYRQINRQVEVVRDVASSVLEISRGYENSLKQLVEQTMKESDESLYKKALQAIGEIRAYLEEKRGELDKTLQALRSCPEKIEPHLRSSREKNGNDPV